LASLGKLSGISGFIRKYKDISGPKIKNQEIQEFQDNSDPWLFQPD